MIDPNRVEKILAEVIGGAEPPISGITRSFAIDRAKAAAHRAEVVAMLEQLPDAFMDDGGGGWSFLNLCQTKAGELWTGMHSTCEALIVLAESLDLSAYLLPRDLWSALPGGMPYVMFRRTAFRG